MKTYSPTTAEEVREQAVREVRRFLKLRECGESIGTMEDFILHWYSDDPELAEAVSCLMEEWELEDWEQEEYDPEFRETD